jgi:catechol 2,3-dioxygenase-like lactoylglutathione lyase family enzyme
MPSLPTAGGETEHEVGVFGVNHIAFRTPDPAGLKRFYAELLAAEPVEGAHDPLRVGRTLLVFFESQEAGVPADPDEISFDCDAAGFADCHDRAQALGAVQREPVRHTPWSQGFVVRDPDGRRIELTHDDLGVYWRE